MALEFQELSKNARLSLPVESVAAFLAAAALITDSITTIERNTLAFVVLAFGASVCAMASWLNIQRNDSKQKLYLVLWALLGFVFWAISIRKDLFLDALQPLGITIIQILVVFHVSVSAILGIKPVESEKGSQ